MIEGEKLNTIMLAPASIEEEFDDIGSHNHSMVQANLAYLVKGLGNYTVDSELSLGVSQLDRARYNLKDEVIVDVCLYPKRPLRIPRDILRMTEMPLLAVEILSPRWGTGSILEKFEAYFVLGIRSCWLVDPLTQTVHVYRSPTQRTTFSVGLADNELVDQTMQIKIPIAAIFE